VVKRSLRTELTALSGTPFHNGLLAVPLTTPRGASKLSDEEEPAAEAEREEILNVGPTSPKEESV
jgi:hypothetical protein